jgi:alanyl-tRNA synthetase
LDQTLFFPEEGGQTPDKGTINGIAVTDVQIKGDEIIHYLEVPLTVGETVTGEIDWKHRFSNMQQHSGEHIFSGTAYKKYGYRNVGFHLSDQIVTMDFDHPFTEEQLAEMEWAVNEAIVANVEVVTGYPSKDVLSQIEYRSKIDFDEGVRIVEI